MQYAQAFESCERSLRRSHRLIEEKGRYGPEQIAEISIMIRSTSHRVRHSHRMFERADLIDRSMIDVG